MAEELYKIPLIWGVRFFSLFFRKTELLTEAMEVLPSRVPVEANSDDLVCWHQRWPCIILRDTIKGCRTSVHP